MIASMVATASKHERAYQVIRGRILSGAYGPGHRLVLDTLARELDVSPVPVREAIRRLEAEGWVTYQRHVGAQVTPFNHTEWEEAMHTLALLEGYATALAAPNMRQKDIEQALAINEELRETLRSLDAQRFSTRNRDFHFVFVNRCENDYLTALVRQAWDRLDVIRRSIFLYIPFRADASVEEHEAIVALIRDGASPAEIEIAAREHKLHTVNAYRSTKTRGSLGLAAPGEGGQP
jgi:DNA-binding GntR family transcriptional regulator